MVRGALVAVLVLVGSAPADGQTPAPRPDWASYGVMVGGNVADIWTTGQAFQRGAHEGNGITSTNRIGPLAVSKACAVVAIAVAMRLLERRGHPTIARVVGYLDSGVTVAAAVHNTKVAR